MHATETGAGKGTTDLLGLGMDFEYVSPERQVLMSTSQDVEDNLRPIYLVDDEAMEVEMPEWEQTTRQDSNGAKLRADEQARSNVNFDKTAPRPIRAHHSRRFHHDYDPPYRQSHPNPPRHTTYYDSGDHRRRAYCHERRYRTSSPDTLRDRAEAASVSAMADLDVKEEPRDDRRGVDSYRGGGYNNKRRRDGKLAMKRPDLIATLTRADDNDNYSRDRGRGPQRRRHDEGLQRRKFEEAPFPRLRRLLLHIASSTKLPQDEAIEIAKVFGENFDDERLRSDVFDIWVQL